MLDTSRNRRLLRVVAFAVPGLLAALATGPITGVVATGPPVVAFIGPPSIGSECGGTIVPITGSGFTGATAVDFGATPATSFTVNSDTSITATAPAHDVGNVDVTVTAGGQTSPTNPNDAFSYYDQAPSITSVTPSSGNAAGDTTVTIAGACFVDKSNFGWVNFGTPATSSSVPTTSVPVQSVSADGTSLTAVTPAVAANTPPSPVNVTLTTARFQTSSTMAPYTFVNPMTVSGVGNSTNGQPNGAAAGGDTVTIDGDGFVSAGANPCAAVTKVTFGGVIASNIANCQPAPNPPSDPARTSLTVTTPAAADTTQNTTVDVQVWDCDDCGSAINAGDKFTYLAAPTVTGLNPRGGPPTTSIPVAVSGTNFTNPAGACQITHVYFGTAAHDAEPSLSNCTATSFDVNSPPQSAGIVDVRVLTGGGESAINQPADQFTYAGVFVSSVSPDGGLGSAASATDAVKVFGNGFTFGGLPDVKSVTFCTNVNAGTCATGSPAAPHFTVMSDGEVDVTAPADPFSAADPRQVDVQVVTFDNGTSALSPPSDVYTFAAAASTITSVSPNAGAVGGGTHITIHGNGFFGGEGSCDVQSVTVGGVAATFNPATDCTSDLAINAITPPGSSGPATVHVFTDEGQDTSTTNDTFTYVGGPTVTSVVPNSGPVAGGNQVTVNGTGFQGGTSPATCDIKSVKFGTTAAANPASCSDTSFTVLVPAGSPGTVDVTVTTNNGGTSATSAADRYTYSNACNTPTGNVVNGAGSGGTAYSQPTGSTWVQRPGSAVYVASGGGQTFVLGTNQVPGGYGIYRWTGSGWAAYPGGLVELAVGPDGSPWGINSGQQIYHWTGGGWQQLAGSAYDIAVGPGGTAFVLGTNSVPGGCGIYRWTGSGFVNYAGGGVQIAIGSNDWPWVINNNDSIYSYNGGGFIQQQGSAQRIAATAGSVWVLGTNAVPGGWGIYYFTGTGWGSLAGGGESIAVGTNKLPWVTNSSNGIYQRS